MKTVRKTEKSVFKIDNFIESDKKFKAKIEENYVDFSYD